MSKYSQGNEEEVILDYFKHQVGVFLDCGANDGSTLSNTRALAELGWSGICVEPCFLPFKKLKSLYEDNHRIQCINVAVGTTNGTQVFYESGSHLKKGDTGLLSTLSKEETKRWKGTEQFIETNVEVVDFQTLLVMSVYQKFDMATIDCEGMDYAILRQMDLLNLGIKLLVIEFNNQDQDKFDDFMLPKGYKLIHKNYENLIYAL